MNPSILTQFLSEANGNPSFMRVMSLLTLLLAIGVVANSIMKGTVPDETTLVTLLGFAYGGKIVQKSQEAKVDPAPPTVPPVALVPVTQAP